MSVVPFARRSLLHDRLRFLLSVSAVAVAMLLVLVLRGIVDGTIDKATWYVERVDADLFVTQEGVGNMGLSMPVIPVSVESALEAVPGVSDVGGIIRVPAVVRLRSSEVPTSILGFDPDSGIGGPWAIEEGSRQLSPDGAIIDVQLARQQDLALGDPVEIAGRTFAIEALARETNAMATGRVVFIRRDVAAELFLMQGALSWVLVRTDGADPASVGSAIEEALPGVVAHTRLALREHDQDLFRDLFGLPVNVMATIGYGVGLLVVGLSTYAAAADRSRDFGVLKAIGARDRFLYRTVVEIAMAIAACGFLLGLLLALAAAPVVTTLAPELGVSYQPPFVLQVVVVSALFALAAALIPARRVSRLDPKDALQ